MGLPSTRRSRSKKKNRTPHLFKLNLGNYKIPRFISSIYRFKSPDFRLFAFCLLKTSVTMAFTMHAHSGQFCPGHAVDQLEDIIKHAISLGYKTIGLTEHMPRYDEEDLYPEEVCLTLSFVHLFPNLVYCLALHSIQLTPTPPSHIHMSLILSHSPSHTTTHSYPLHSPIYHHQPHKIVSNSQTP